MFFPHTRWSLEPNSSTICCSFAAFNNHCSLSILVSTAHAQPKQVTTSFQFHRNSSFIDTRQHGTHRTDAKYHTDLTTSYYQHDSRPLSAQQTNIQTKRPHRSDCNAPARKPHHFDLSSQWPCLHFRRTHGSLPGISCTRQNWPNGT